jgi:hypothetical protein
MELISSYYKETSVCFHVCTVAIIQMMVIWEMCHLYIIITFPHPNHFNNHLNQIQSSWRWRYHAPLKCQNRLAAQCVDPETIIEETVKHYGKRCQTVVVYLKCCKWESA